MQAPVRSTPANAILLREAIGPIAVLTLNRPQARNSLSEDLLAALSAELAAIAGDPGVRAVVLAANGPAFCAGHDMRELLARVPVKVILNPEAGLIGAAVCAQELMGSV